MQKIKNNKEGGNFIGALAILGVAIILLARASAQNETNETDDGFNISNFIGDIFDVFRTNNTSNDTNFTGASNNTVTICHVPPGNSSANETITINDNAVQTHLDHG